MIHNSKILVCLMLVAQFIASMSLSVPPCYYKICGEHGLCKNNLHLFTPHEFQCTCELGFTGARCEVNVDNCTPNPCANNGCCVDGINEFTCTCPLGFEGLTCENNINMCENSGAQLCLHGGVCTSGINSYVCTCPTGYTGDNCEIDINECAGNPCLNGGTCTDKIADFSCACAGLFYGKTCDTTIQNTLFITRLSVNLSTPAAARAVGIYTATGKATLKAGALAVPPRMVPPNVFPTVIANVESWFANTGVPADVMASIDGAFTSIGIPRANGLMYTTLQVEFMTVRDHNSIFDLYPPTLAAMQTVMPTSAAAITEPTLASTETSGLIDEIADLSTFADFDSSVGCFVDAYITPEGKTEMVRMLDLTNTTAPFTPYHLDYKLANGFSTMTSAYITSQLEGTFTCIHHKNPNIPGSETVKVAYNAAHFDDPTLAEMVINLRDNHAMPISIFTAEICKRDNFAEAFEFAKHTNTTIYGYFSIVGETNIAIVSKTSSGINDVAINTKQNWFQIQTNGNKWQPDNDGRRTYGEQKMTEMGPLNANFHNVWDFARLAPIKRIEALGGRTMHGTIFTGDNMYNIRTL